MSERAGSARVALTFDAEHPDRPRCPEGNIDRILDALQQRDLRATFFIQGRWAEAYPATARRIATDGHVVGNHSHYHAQMPMFDDAGLAADVHAAQEAVVAATGVDPRPWFRTPFGEGHDDARVLDGLGALGYRNVFWHVALEDWEAWRTGADISTDAIEGVRRHGDGCVVLLHTWPGGTGDAIGPLIDGLLASDATFVGIDDLETLP